MLPKLSVHTTSENVKYFLFDQRDVVSDVIRETGSWNSHVIDAVDKILAKSGSGKVLDVGAGMGSFSIPLAIKYDKKYSFVVFEPQRILFLQLAANILLNNCEFIKIFNYLIGNESGLRFGPEVDIRKSHNHESLSFNEKINELRGMPSSKELTETIYEMKTLNEFDFREIKLVKITTCGMEFDVINGGDIMLKQNDYPPVVFEYWQFDWYKDYEELVVKKLIEIGYEYFHDLGTHKIAFKSAAEFKHYMEDGEVIGDLADFQVTEHLHNVEATLEFQAQKQFV
jgi:FkbM family methyltransferase